MQFYIFEMQYITVERPFSVVKSLKNNFQKA